MDHFEIDEARPVCGSFKHKIAKVRIAMGPRAAKDWALKAVGAAQLASGGGGHGWGDRSVVEGDREVDAGNFIDGNCRRTVNGSMELASVKELEGSDLPLLPLGHIDDGTERGVGGAEKSIGTGENRPGTESSLFDPGWAVFAELPAHGVDLDSVHQPSKKVCSSGFSRSAILPF